MLTNELIPYPKYLIIRIQLDAQLLAPALKE
jgi:hypothetical protein